MAIRDELLEGVRETAETVTRAVESGDFSHLSGDINKTVGLTGDRIRSHIDVTKEQNINLTQAWQEHKRKRSEKRRHTSPFQTQDYGTSTGIGEIFIGGVLLMGFGAKFVISLFGTIVGLGSGAFLTAVFGMLVAIGIIKLWKGIESFGLAGDFRACKNIVGDREFIPVRELASKLAVDEKKLLKKLKKMLMKGMLPGARLDENDTTLILTQDAIEQYEQMMKAQKERMEEQKLRTIDASSVSGNEAAQKVLEEGNSYLIRVREINDKIAESDPMSDKLYKLEEIMRRIFEQVSEHPEKSQDLRKFMNYYLPTTEKLLQAYVKLDSQPDVVNVKETKRQISEALDTINVAFENLLDDLFQEQAWDISSDISVMNSMMQQDGLVQGQGRMQAMTREDGFGN